MSKLDTPSKSRFIEGVRNEFVDVGGQSGDGFTQQFEQIQGIDDVYDWLLDTQVPVLAAANKIKVLTPQTYSGPSRNVLLSVDLRQVRKCKPNATATRLGLQTDWRCPAPCSNKCEHCNLLADCPCVMETQLQSVVQGLQDAATTDPATAGITPCFLHQLTSSCTTLPNNQMVHSNPGWLAGTRCSNIAVLDQLELFTSNALKANNWLDELTQQVSMVLYSRLCCLRRCIDQGVI
jgi:hypothetical protein